MNGRRPFIVVLFLTIFGAIVFVARYGHDGGQLKKVDNWIHSGGNEKEPEPTPCTEHLGWLEPYQFSYPIQYVSRDIITSPRPNSDRPSLTTMDKALFDDYTTVDLSKSATVNIGHCLPALTLEVPHPKMAPADASNMIFGMQTTMNRLKDTVKHLARWLPNTNARLYAIVKQSEDVAADEGEMAKLQKEFHDQGMNVTVMHPVAPGDSFAQRYFSLVGVMYAAKNDKTQWIVTIDDDTFFPSMHDLLTMLKTYDPTKPQYLGSLSEDWWAVNNYGLMGFGGAGILLSVPTAKVIYDHLDECKEHLRTTAGDISVMDCIYQHSSTKLTHIPALHQVDMHGDLSGFYESGREMLSLHHWKEGSAAGYKLEMEKMHLVADVCDSCFLQRWQFPNDMVLTNGFSIAHYPQGHLSGKSPNLMGGDVKQINLEEMEKTWGDEINVLHSLAPLRSQLNEPAKIGYKLLDSVLVDTAGAPGKKDVVRQVYFKEGLEKEGGGKEQDYVLVLNWRAGDAAPPPSTPPLPMVDATPPPLDPLPRV